VVVQLKIVGIRADGGAQAGHYAFGRVFPAGVHVLDARVQEGRPQQVGTDRIEGRQCGGEGVHGEYVQLATLNVRGRRVP
jgi:hypothetical protein